MHSLFFFGFPLTNLKLSLGSLLSIKHCWLSWACERTFSMSTAFSAPAAKNYFPLTTERASRECVCDTGHAFEPRNVNPAWTGLTADKGRNEDTLILHEKISRN